MPNPFTNRSMITDRRQFYGRAEPLERIFDRLNGSQPGSVSVVGERRIGRSSLLYHVKQVAPERLARPDAFRFVYVDLQSDVIISPDAFRGYALARLIGAGDGQGSAIQAVAPDAFEQALGELAQQRLHPVLLLDEFEQVIDDEAFPARFFDGLRSLANGHLITYVIATHESLSEYELTHPKLSSLHGVCELVPLGEFVEPEARALLSQPADWTLNSHQVNFGLKLAGLHPLRLNVAGDCIYRHLARHHGGWSGQQERAAREDYQAAERAIFSGKLNPRPSLDERWRKLRARKIQIGDRQIGLLALLFGVLSCIGTWVAIVVAIWLTRPDAAVNATATPTAVTAPAAMTPTP